MKFEREKITEHIWRIRGTGDACMYFIEGSERGILVDTAYGVGDLKGYVENTWRLPYDVVITHGHADHANGIGQFFTVYMNSRDIELYRTRTDIALRRKMLKRTVKDIDAVPDDAFIPPFYGVFRELRDGMRFPLGNAEAEVYSAPGHTEGMMVILVPEDRTMLFGDACGVCTFLFKPESSTVEKYLNTLKKLKAMDDRYDRILRQHGTCESPKSLVDENIECAELILAGKDDHVPFEYMGDHVWMAKKINPDTGMRTDGKSGNIVYAMNKIYEKEIG